MITAKLSLVLTKLATFLLCFFEFWTCRLLNRISRNVPSSVWCHVGIKGEFKRRKCQVLDSEERTLFHNPDTPDETRDQPALLWGSNHSSISLSLSDWPSEWSRTPRVFNETRLKIRSSDWPFLMRNLVSNLKQL